MATYYKYAERSADSQVNWAEVGKGISDMLADEVKIREEKKAGNHPFPTARARQSTPL